MSRYLSYNKALTGTRQKLKVDGNSKILDQNNAREKTLETMKDPKSFGTHGQAFH